MQLYLCRHGEAVDAGGDISDEMRWLTVGGRQEVARVGELLRAQGDIPSLILTSPLVRAVQTAAELALAVGYDRAVEVLPALAPKGRLGEVLRDLEGYGPQFKSVFLVGHEPQMGEWTATLLGRATLGRAFEKGGVVRINFASTAEPGVGRAAFYLSPQHLRPLPI
jgi:phosphohistidine phosphatase